MSSLAILKPARYLKVTYFLLYCSLVDVDGTITIRGAGASFPSAVYNTWIPSYKAYRIRHQSLKMTYDALGSGAGKRLIKGIDGEAVHYAGSDSVLTESEYNEYPDLQMFPTMAGAVVLGYNLPGFQSLNISRHTLVGIYNGTITWWNDTELQAINPGAKLPDKRIIVVARLDRSGTTEIFTTALDKFSEEWHRTYGIFTGKTNNGSSTWNPSAISYFGNYNHGVAGLIGSFEYSIGYVSVADAESFNLPYAKFINKYGSLVDAQVDSIQSAMDDFAKTFDSRMTASLADGPGEHSYPIAGYTYFIIHLTTMKQCDAAMELYRYIEWFLHNQAARSDCGQLSMVPLSASVSKIVMNILRNFTCQGHFVSSLVAKQKHEELISLQSWRVPVFVSTPLAVLLVISLVAYIVYQQYQVQRALMKDEWRIPTGKVTEIEKFSGRSVVSVSSKRSNETMVSLTIMGFSSYLYYGYKDSELVSLRPLNLDIYKNLRKNTRKTMLYMKDQVNHINVLRFYGLTQNIQGLNLIVSEGCEKGILQDIIHNDRYNLDENFKFSMSLDIACGMEYLHDRDIVHGQLMSSCCLIDSRWTVKVSDWEYNTLTQCENNVTLRHELQDEDDDEEVVARRMLWLSPEVLHDLKSPPQKSSDVYSFSLLLLELFTRASPYSDEVQKANCVSVITQIMYKNIRPTLPHVLPRSTVPIIECSWAEVPQDRPKFSQLIKMLKKARPSNKSVLDCMMKALDEYLNQLEEKVEERTAEVRIAKERMEHLLHQILPPSVATKLAAGETVQPESFESVTIYFSDIVGFTTLSSESTPFEVVDMLNDLYTVFDAIIEQHDVYKVETIGDAYMVISGLPSRNGDKHAEHIANMALDLASSVANFKIRHRQNMMLRLRMGIHSGRCVAGVVGIKMPRYCLFGDTVNTASRMESTSVALKIQISETTNSFLEATDNYIIKLRGEILVKGKGRMQTFWLHGRKDIDKNIPKEFLRDVLSPSKDEIHNL